MKSSNRVSRKLSFILRHNPTAFSISIDVNGWCLISDVLSKGTLGISRSELFSIVEDDNKNRYEVSFDKRKIRARQGHSFAGVNLEFKILNPMPSLLYHGTSVNNLESIMKSGYIESMSRHYVHLSMDIETARMVGSRHGKVVVIEIDTSKLKEPVYLSDNNVALTKRVSKDAFARIIYV